MIFLHNVPDLDGKAFVGKRCISIMYDHDPNNETVSLQEDKCEKAFHDSIVLTSPFKKQRYHFFQLALLALFVVLQTVSATLPQSPQWRQQNQPLTIRAANDTPPLECLQVAPPVPNPATSCKQTLMEYVFAYSYGQPFIGAYVPPSCDFNRVTFNFTVSSAGRQFDRLGLMFLGDMEVFRTSTAEPTRTGIAWTYLKDMSAYLSAFKTSQKIIFDLGNLVDDTYTGVWNTTLTATFFTADDDIEPADVILPVSAQKSSDNASSVFVVPETTATLALTLPSNARKAVFSISACGQAAEEFWWSNVLTSDSNAFGNGTTLYGHSAFRELQLVIDGQLAGVAWPFPIIFTGGIVPGFWRPVVGIDAFDLQEDEIDISPFIPLLSDGQPHTFEIRVLGIDDDGQGNGQLTQGIESNWVVTGKVFVWLDASSASTTGSIPTIDAPTPEIRLRSSRNGLTNGTVDTLDYAVEVSRTLIIESTIQSSSGLETVRWTQNLTFSNAGTLSNGGNDQLVSQDTTGTHVSQGFRKSYEYPLWVISSYNYPIGGNLSINGRIGRGKYTTQTGDLAFPNEWKTFDYSRLLGSHNQLFTGSNINNFQNGTATYLSVPAQRVSFGTGNTEQLYSLKGLGDSVTGSSTAPSEDLYFRHIVALNDSVIFDDERIGGQPIQRSRLLRTSGGASRPEYASTGVKALLGRGPRVVR